MVSFLVVLDILSGRLHVIKYLSHNSKTADGVSAESASDAE